MKQIFKLTNKFIVLAMPLILFILLSNIYALVMVNGKNIINLFIAMILLLFMTAAFISGWGEMIKSAVMNPDNNEPNSIIKQFTSGVGEYFLASYMCLMIFILVNILVLVFAYLCGKFSVGDIGISAKIFANAMTNPELLKTFLASLSHEQLIKINLWNLIFLIAISATYFLFIFYMPALFFKTKNPFIALGISIKNVLSKFFNVAGIYFLIILSNFVISICSALTINNTVLNFIMTLINFYYITFVAVWLFSYYYDNFVKEQKGNSIDTYI